MILRILRGPALIAATLPAGVIAWLALHPAPPPLNKPLFAGAQIDQPTLALFQRACQNCHSANTQWPWYSQIPPTSFLVRKDVDQARRHANFSNWDSYRPDEQQDLLSRIGSVARSGQMPLPRYTWLHREAILTTEERQQIYEWTRGERKRLRRIAP
jgi:hypothetical protein